MFNDKDILIIEIIDKGDIFERKVNIVGTD